MRQFLTLNKDGRLAVRSGSGSEKVIEHRVSNARILLDTSHSMAGIKIQ